MLMFKNILLSTDLTDRTVRALEAAARLAGLDRSHVVVFHVIETVPNLEFDELKPFYDRLEARARAKMDEFITRLRSEGVPSVSAELVYGRRAEEIVRRAGTGEVDLLILGSHTIEPGEAGPGSISYKASMFAPCAVLLLK